MATGADGNTEYWYCEDCGKYYADAEAKTEIEEGSWVIPAYGYSTVTLPQSRSIMTTGQVIELKPEVSGHSTQLTWKSSKPSVATVDKNGVVKAIEPGTAKISVTVKDGNTATFTVTVKDYSYKAEADMRAIKREYPHAQGILGYVYAYTNLDGEDIVLTHVGYKIKSLFHADYMHNLTTGRTYQDSGIESYFQTNIDRPFGVTKLHWMELQNEQLAASARMLAGKGYVFRYNKYENPMTVKAKAVTVKYSAVKKKAVTVAKKKVFTIKKAQGKVTFKKTKGNKKITISKAGVITVKKGLKKGTYTVKIKVTAAGNGNYKSKTKTVTVTVKVK